MGRAHAEVYVDALPQGSIAVMYNFPAFVNWQLARRAKEYARANDLEQLLGHLQANQDERDKVMEALTIYPLARGVPRRDRARRAT